LAFGFWLLAFGTNNVSGQAADFTADLTTVCIGASVTFTNLSVGTGTITYSWDFGANATPSTASTFGPHIVTYSTAGPKTVVLTITDDNGSDTETKTSYITVTPDNTVSTASSAPTLCINTALTAITHTTTGATGIGAPTGLPTGVTAAWASDVITISGTPSASGPFSYSIPLTGGCGTVTATGTITVTPNKTVSAASSAPTLCINTALTPITHTTSGATGIGAPTGLPSGVTASWAANTITISGIPSASGPFSYSIPLTGGCGTVTATGTITVTPDNTVSTASSAPTLCINTALTAITHTTTGATGIGAPTGLPTGVTAAWAANTITISGIPSASGPFSYSIPLIGGCGTVTATGTITVTPNNTVTLSSAIGSNNQSLCINNAITNITYTTTGATGGTVTGLPTGVSGSWAANVVTITGTPSVAGSFNYLVTLTGGCGIITSSGTINVIANPVSSVTITSSESTVCIGTTVNYTAIPTNGGASPSYQWKVNGTNIGPNLSTFSYTPNNGDNVWVVMTSSLACALPVSSNTITMTVVSSFAPSLTISGNNNICLGNTSTFTATPVSAGNNPIFTWYVNNVVQAGHTTSTFTYVPANNNQVRATVLSSACSGGTANSNVITMIVNPILPTSVSISSATEVCANVEVLYTAIPVNGGASPAYNWFVNDISVASPGFQFTYTPSDEDEIVVHMTSSLSCVTSSTVISPSITMTVDPIMPVSVTITASDPDLQICQNTPVTYTAIPVNGGVSPTYQWKVNNNNQGTNSSIFTYNPANNDIIRVVLTSDEICASGNPATSNALQMTVSTQLVVGVGLTVSSNNICNGQSVTFTATPYNGGSSPMYQWKVGGTNVGPLTVSNTFTYTPTNGQQISVTMTSNETCILNPTVTSDVITMIVNPLVVPTVNVFATSTKICDGEPIAFSALVTNGGPTPSFQWKMDGVNVGPNNPVYSFNPPVGSHTMTVQVTSSLACVTLPTVTAIPVSFVVDAKLPVSVSIRSNDTTVCAGTAVTFTALTQNPGTTPGFTWKVNGGTVGTSSNTFSYAPANNDQVWVILTSSETCSTVNPATSTPIVMNVLPTPSVNLTFTQGTSSACIGDSIKMTTVYNLAYLYTWFVDNVQVKTGQGVNANNYAFKLNQTKTVRVQVKLGDCIVENIQTVIANPLPVIQITASDPQICEGDPVTLTLTGISGTTWHWINPDYVLNYTPITIYPQTGVQVFSAEATNFFGCVNTATATIEVIAKPVVDIVAVGGQFACTNAPKSFTATQNSNFTYKWFVNDQLQVGAISHTFADTLTGVLAVEVKVQATNTITGCFNSDSTIITPIVSPILIMTPTDTELCPGEQTFITLSSATAPPVYYAWGDGLQGNVLTRGFIPTADTLVWAEAINPTGCITRDTLYISVNPAPVAQINNPAQTVVCEGQTVTLTTSVLANHQYKWMVAGDSLASGATFAFVALQTTEVVLVVKNQYGCEKTDTLTITVEDAPNVELGANVSVCTNYIYTLTGPQNVNYTYKWYVNNQLIANNTFEYSFKVTQAVTVRLEVKVGNCTTTDQIVITPLAVPVINVTANNAAICFGEPVVLSLSTQNASSYVWWDGFTGLTTRTIVPVENDTTLAYWAEAINGIGCRSRDTVLVRVNPLPLVPLTVAGGSNIVCYNAVATVQGPQVAGHQYEWFIDDVATGTNTYQLSFTVTKDVTVKLQVTDASGCENTNQIAIQSRNLPGILLSPDSLEVCLGNSFTLAINNQNVNSYSWFDGLAGNLLQRTFEATTTGSFIYWVEGMNSFGCISRDTAFITVNALPDIFIFAPGGTTVCQAEEITLVGSGQEDDLYEWYVNDLLVNNTSTYTFVAGQTTDVSLIVTNVAGCQQTDVITINVLDAPEVDLGADLQVCEGYTLTFTGPLDSDHIYGWFVNNILVSTDSSYTFVLTGNINLRLDVTSPDGCSASDTVAITTLPSPTINVTPDNTEFCLGESATLSLTTNGSSYIWWDGLGTNVPTRSFTPSVGDSTYAYWAKAVSLNGCTSSDTAYVKVNNHPVIDIAIQGLANTFCFGSQATIVGPSVEGYTYQWYVNGLEAGENSDRLIFAVTSESLVKLEVTDSNGCFGADSLTVFMHTAPGILLSPDSLDICIGQSFTLTIDPINVLSFAWWDGLAGNQTNRTITPTIPDMTYMYWAQGINSIGCISFDTAYITVHSLPAAVLLTPLGTSICQGETMILQTPVEEGYTYEWLVDGETLSTEAQLEFVAETSVSVTLIVTNEFNCSTSETVEIEVFITPVIAFGDDIFACLNEKVVVEGPLGTGFTYEWLLNGANTGVTSPTFEYEVVDTVSIVLNMNTTNGCIASDTIVITPLLTPKVTIDASADAFCLGESVTLTASVVDAVAFEWWDGFTNPVRIITPETSGITHYWAEVTSAANCVSRDSISLLVHPNPEIQLAIFEGTPEVCEGGSIMFAVSDNAGIEIDYVVWDKDVTVPMGDEPVLYFEKVFNESSWFFAEMVSVNGCSVSDSIFVTVEPLPEMTISNDTTVCSGETVILESTGGILCIWSDETGMVGAGYTLEIQATETKKYYATVIGDGNLGCSQTDSVTVTVYPLPEVMVQASQQNVCGGTPIVLVASGADSYVWSTGQTGTVITVYPLQTTTYSVTGINESGCSEVALLTVNIIPTPVVTLVGLEEFYCTTAEPAVLTGTPAGGIYSGGIGVIAGKFYPSIAGQGIHQVVYSYVNSFGCTGSDTLQTTVVGITEAINLGENAIICPHEEVVFDAGPGYQKYFWSTGDTTRTTTISGNTYFAGTTRTITVIATIQECSVMGSVELTIRNDCYIGIDEIETKEDMVLIPNPSRGEFIIQHKGGEGELQVSIFDGRSGNVYAGTFETCSEDGRQCKIDLSHLPKGVYMVSIIRGDRRFVRKMVIM